MAREGVACNKFLIQRQGVHFSPHADGKNRLLFDQSDIGTKTNQGSVEEGLQAQLNQGIGPTQDLVVLEICSCLYSLGNPRGVQLQEVQPSPLQTSGRTECL